jgi:hypothetical protein
MGNLIPDHMRVVHVLGGVWIFTAEQKFPVCVEQLSFNSWLEKA